MCELNVKVSARRWTSTLGVSIALVSCLGLGLAGCGKSPQGPSKTAGTPPAGTPLAGGGKAVAEPGAAKPAAAGAEAGAAQGAAAAKPTAGAAPGAKAAGTPAGGAKVRVRQRGMPRATLNRLLAAIDEPVFWRQDTNGNGLPDADEISVLWHPDSLGSAEDWARFTTGTRLTPEWRRVWNRARLVKAGGWPWRGLDDAELARRKAVVRELEQGRPTLIATDLTKEAAHVRAFAGHMAKAGRYIEVLYRRQLGSLGLDKQIPPRDLPSLAIYHRNQGPWCQAPETEKDATCHGVPSMPKRRSGLYPLSLQLRDPWFCEHLAKRPDAKALFAPFVAVQSAAPVKPAAKPKPPKPAVAAKGEKAGKGAKAGAKVAAKAAAGSGAKVVKQAKIQPLGRKAAAKWTRSAELKAVPYPKAFPDETAAIARELDAAAKAMQADPKEAPLVAYLKAAAAAFRTNDWFSADEAWSKMAGSSSQWYVRIGPDETYFEPCSRKAGFHLVWARIDPGSAAWKSKLEPKKDALEALVAQVAGAPYKARSITFHLPEFIHIVLNAGDSRSPTGATVGQSLPNWGPVAEESRGRTVAMTNLYTDPDSVESLKAQSAALFCKDTWAQLTFDDGPQTMSTVLHEAGHNLGPSHAYKVEGQTDDERFGGPLAATLEELKAQTMALHFNPWLVKQKLITQQFGRAAWLRDMAWAFGHISRGMTTSNGKPKAYSQLAAVQLGLLHQGKGMVWKAKQLAANGKDTGCFEADFKAFGVAVDDMAKQVYGIKARGDVKAAKALVKRYVSEGTAFAKLRDTIRERWLRAPRATFVYGLRY